jgi:hypothetical protein
MPTNTPSFFWQMMRIMVANRMLVYWGASGVTGKPTA